MEPVLEPAFNLTWITLLAVIALGCGLTLMRLRQPAIVGYIIAGVILGPSGFGLVDDDEGVRTFAELGVLLLLFIIGMEISLRALRQVFVIVIATALLQLAVALGIAFLLAPLAGWSIANALVFGFILALSSTAVGIKLLEEIGKLRSEVGRVTIGVLVAQDLLVVPMLIVVNAFGANQSVDLWLGIKLGIAVGGLVLLVGYLSRTPRLKIPFADELRGQADLAPLAALSFCFVLATLSGLIGLSASYGAFIAGLIIGATAERHRVLRSSLPIQSILMMVFFLSIGLLIDLGFLWRHLPIVLTLLLASIVIKTVVNILILRLLGVEAENAFLAGIVMGQLGEFSFIIAATALQARTMAGDQYQIALAVIALSLLISPLWLMTLRRAQRIGADHYTKLGAIIDDLYGKEIAGLRAWSGRILDSIGSLRKRQPQDDQATAPKSIRQSDDLMSP